MTERLTQITLQAFRGVRDVFELSLPQAQSLLIFGENGTGKSSLADAIEWYFTGEIELLAKEGRDHAIKHQGAPSKTQPIVALATNGDLSGSCTTKAPNKAAIEAASRETFLLRGRTIADFVDKSKGEKWSALQRLLGLSAIDELRADLQKARSELKKARDDAAAKTKQAAAALVALKVPAEKSALEEALSTLATACGFERQASIDDYLRLNIKDLIEPPRSAGQSRATAVAALIEEVRTRTRTVEVSAFARWNSTLEAPSTVDTTRVDVLNSAARWALKNPESKTCPVCDKKIEAEKLKAKLLKVLADVQEHTAAFDVAEKDARAALDIVTTIQQERSRYFGKTRDLKIELGKTPAEVAGAVKAAISERRSIDVGVVQAYLTSLEEWDEALAKALDLAKPPNEEAAPQTGQAFALAQLLLAAKTWTDALVVDRTAEGAFERADALFEAYQTEQRKYVQTVLEQISAEVARLFSRLHPSKNISSVAVETWADKGIELAIDFYGQRQRPPHGVLSESYMNSVAIVLFLAMARTFNEKLNFLVLDDVVNSFDVTHRGRLGDLLLEEFQDWQLIVLTHDRYFFDQVRRKVKGWATYQFLGWSYERGTALREQKGRTDVDAALDLLSEGHIGDAARRGRRGLESVLKEICEGLEVPLPYKRGNENEFREVGTLLNGLRRLLKEDSKGKQFLAAIDGTLRSLEADAQSVLNVEAHASEAGASSSEVESTLQRVKAFDELWTCVSCNSRVWKEQGVRCKCGATPFPPPIAKINAAASP